MHFSKVQGQKKKKKKGVSVPFKQNKKLSTNRAIIVDEKKKKKSLFDYSLLFVCGINSNFKSFINYLFCHTITHIYCFDIRDSYESLFLLYS